MTSISKNEVLVFTWLKKSASKPWELGWPAEEGLGLDVTLGVADTNPENPNKSSSTITWRIKINKINN